MDTVNHVQDCSLSRLYNLETKRLFCHGRLCRCQATSESGINTEVLDPSTQRGLSVRFESLAHRLARAHTATGGALEDFQAKTLGSVGNRRWQSTEKIWAMAAVAAAC